MKSIDAGFFGGVHQLRPTSDPALARSTYRPPLRPLIRKLPLGFTHASTDCNRCGPAATGGTGIATIASPQVLVFATKLRICPLMLYLGASFIWIVKGPAVSPGPT